MAPKKNRYSRKLRLTRENELEVTKKTGKQLRTEHLEVRVAISLLVYCRVTVVVAKYGHTIVERNRLRRRLRELARVRLLPECIGVDVVIRALPEAYKMDFNELSAEIGKIKGEIMLIVPQG